MIERGVRLGLVFVAGVVVADGVRVAWAKCDPYPELRQDLELVESSGDHVWSEQAEIVVSDRGDSIRVAVELADEILWCDSVPEAP
jgi:hypothetical protein